MNKYPHDDWDKELESSLDLSGKSDVAGARSADVQSLIDVADAVWVASQGAPPLESDPVAALLGLVPDPDFTLEPRALARARKRRGLKPSELAEKLRSRGWKVQASDIFQWETRGGHEVSPALIRAIAEEVVTPIDALTRRQRDSKSDAVSQAVRRPQFQALVNRWARLANLPISEASSALKSRMLTTVYRGDHADAEQLLYALEALISALEADADDGH